MTDNEAKLRAFIKTLLDDHDWYGSAIELDFYADGETLEQEAKDLREETK